MDLCFLLYEISPFWFFFTGFLLYGYKISPLWISGLWTSGLLLIVQKGLRFMVSLSVPG